MAIASNIPEVDQMQLINYIDLEFHGLHEGNVIRYRLQPQDITGISRK